MIQPLLVLPLFFSYLSYLFLCSLHLAGDEGFDPLVFPQHTPRYCTLLLTQKQLKPNYSDVRYTILYPPINPNHCTV
jgi:hypothetical protein